jgi:hypothetical protein
MAKIVLQEVLTLDGVMHGPGGPDEHRSGGFDKGGWQLGYADKTLGTYVIDGLKSAGGYLLGRRTADATRRLRLADFTPATAGVLLLTYTPEPAI